MTHADAADHSQDRTEQGTAGRGGRSGEALLFWIGLGVTIAAAVLLRAFYLHDYADSPLFRTACGPDVIEYHDAAQSIRAGLWLWTGVLTHGPLYPYLLALWCTLADNSLPAVRALQLLIGVVACVIVTLAVRRRCGPPAALCTAGLWAVTVPIVYYEAELLSEGLSLFLNSCVVALLIARPTIGAGRAVLVGLLLGLAAITHATAVLFAVFVVVWLAVAGRRAGGRPAWLAAVLAGAGLALPTVPVAAYNWHMAGEFVLLQETAGLNFYQGNNPQATGTNYIRLGPDWDQLVARPYVEAGLKEGVLHGGFHYRRAFQFIREEPGRWLLLLARKAALSLNSQELTASMPVATIRPAIRLLQWPLPGFGVLLALALVGLSCARGGRLIPVWLLGLAYVLAQVIFFATGRHRVPMLPGALVLAGLGLAHLAATLHGRRWRGAAFAGIPLLVGVAISRLPVVPAGNDDPAEAALTRAMAYQRGGDLERGIEEARKAAALCPTYAPALLKLGELLRDSGRPAEALEQYRAAVGARPDYARAHVALAGALLRQDGNLEAAQPHYLRALEIDPADRRVRNLYAQVLLAWGQYASAAEQFRLLLSQGPDAGAAAGLGEALARLGEYSEAAELLEVAAAARPHDARILRVLARVRAACPEPRLREPERALRLADEAARLTGYADPEALDVLGMALANVGLFEPATEAANMAWELTRRRGDAVLAEEILARRELYARQRPYRDPAGRTLQEPAAPPP